MTQRWVAIDVAMGDNPKVWRFAEALYSPRARQADLVLPATVGHLAMVFGAIKINAPSGDLSEVPDDLLELWAKWRGPRGRFATAFRAAFVRDGKVHDWDQWNGRLIRRQEAERERWHRRQERPLAQETPRRDSRIPSTPTTADTTSGASTSHARGASVPDDTSIPAGASTGDSGGDSAEAPAAPNLTIPDLEITTTTTTARACARVREVLPEPYRQDFDEAFDATNRPAALAAELQALHDDTHGTGTAYSWAEIGLGLHDLVANGKHKSFNARQLRRYIEGAREQLRAEPRTGPAVAAIGAGGKTYLNALRALEEP